MTSTSLTQIQKQVFSLEITNENDRLFSNQSIIIDRVPIEFADYSIKPYRHENFQGQFSQANLGQSQIGIKTQQQQNIQQSQVQQSQQQIPKQQQQKIEEQPIQPQQHQSQQQQSLLSQIPIQQQVQAKPQEQQSQQIFRHESQSKQQQIPSQQILQQMPVYQQEHVYDQKNSLIESVFTPEEYEASLKSARYFIIRSANQENIELSRQHCEWATTKANEGKLTEAFLSTKFVYLIFAVTRTYYFQGLALMTSNVSNKIASYWKSNEGIKLGGCFKIKWITTSNLFFTKINNLTNPYADNELVRKSRDCTELEPGVGQSLCLLFELPFRQPETQCPLQPQFIKSLQFLMNLQKQPIENIQAKGNFQTVHQVAETQRQNQITSQQLKQTIQFKENQPNEQAHKNIDQQKQVYQKMLQQQEVSETGTKIQKLLNRLISESNEKKENEISSQISKNDGKNNNEEQKQKSRENTESKSSISKSIKKKKHKHRHRHHHHHHKKRSHGYKMLKS